jgi:hypothetical protein
MATLWKVRYATSTLSKAPDLHSSMNSARDRALGSITSATSEMAAHSLCALNSGSKTLLLWGSGTRGWGLWHERNLLLDFSQEENLRLAHFDRLGEVLMRGLEIKEGWSWGLLGVYSVWWGRDCPALEKRKVGIKTGDKLRRNQWTKNRADSYI